MKQRKGKSADDTGSSGVSLMPLSTLDPEIQREYKGVTKKKNDTFMVIFVPI